MKVSRCKTSYSVELTIEKDENQHNLTVFEKALASHFNDKVDLDQIEDLLLDMEYVDVSFNNRKIIIAIISHNEK